MLYDNSQLARVYLHAWLLTSEPSQAVTGNGFFRTITEEILDCIACEMLDQPRGFYSTQHANSPVTEDGHGTVLLSGHALPVARGFEIRGTGAKRRELDNREVIFCCPCPNAEQMKGKMDGHG